MTPPHDRDLESLLADDGGDFAALYRRLPRAEPPRRLDRSVIAEAARAVRGNAPRRQHWLVGAGSAAGLVLAAGIAWHVGQDALRQQRLEPAGVQQVVPVQPITGSAPRRDEHSAQALPTPHAAPTAGAPAAAARPADAKPLPPPPPAPAAVPMPFPTRTIQREGAAIGAAPASAQESTAKTGRAGGMSGQAHARLPAAEGQTDAPAVLSDRIEWTRKQQLDPDDWLDRIRRLLHDGHRRQALESLQKFQRAHPGHTLPDDLRALGD